MCDQAQIATRCWTFPAISTMDSFALASQIRSQPAEIERLLADPQAQESAAAAAAVFSAVGRLDIVGIGTSHNAALTAAYMLRAAGLDATAWSSYDYTLYGAGSDAAGGKPLLLLSVRQHCNPPSDHSDPKS
jgi:fructoselysine-6-P-deglycase FrlB-like protein